MEKVADKSLRCIRCGLCLDACPTFRLTGSEADSPRGRIYLMRSVAEGAMTLDADVLSHLDACLGCRACEATCPSGVGYGEILAEFRAHAEASGVRPGLERFARRQLLAALSHPARLAASLRLAGVAGRLAGSDGRMPAFAASLLTGSPGTPVAMPHVPEAIAVGRLPELSRAIGTRRFTVGILEGCVMRVLFHETNQATVRVLQRNGCDVVAPGDAGCCGALHAHSGYLDDARAKARALLDAVADVPMDAFVVNSAGCGSTLKEYGELLADDAVYAARARRFAASVRDVSEFLAEIGPAAPGAPYEATVAYHDACHLAHAQGITAAPRALLQAIPGLRLVDLPDSDMCCGSAGTYNLTQPEMAARLLDRKIDAIVSTGARVVATGNPGCLAWIRQGLEARGLDIAICHPVDILDAAYRASGDPPAADG